MKNLINLLILASIAFISLIKAQTVQKFTSAGTQDQYVPVVFGFTYKPFSISRPEIHENRNWLAYGTATINGIGFGWGSGNTMIKLENFTHGLQNSDNTGNWYSYIGKVMCIWENTGILVYLRGGTTYYTDGNVIKNDGTDSSGKLSSVPITELGFNIPRGIYVADWEINAHTQSMNINNLYSKNGNIGIGNNSPQSKLDINGTIMVGGDTGNLDITSLPNSLDMLKNTGKLAIGWNLSGGGGETNFIANRGKGNTGGFHFYDYTNEGQRKRLLLLNSNGNALLDGKLEAKEIKVTTTPTADFVFEDSYKLPNLESVEKHIKEKKHLPEIASAAEMQKDGVSIGDFQIKLLQKIEELTLYSIEQNKLIKEQQERLKKLEEKQNIKP
ncbi:hypothetical protein [Elizabethkingia anophelis]|uniref:hypothetical protein n=1 Tax=Elizabethkingia anophelis TaxID=1117645 RepID=UPI00200BFAF6|nr:hypothetical protein [Elizabethkingia anophelis]MCL1035119.1 hypothetical protein [Elizabethkingia anophelis]MCW2464385.1 hypothetical protein [Elizabethkingia anophelis]MCW2468068.1 hypothetical protein [Elizabethkingia anophelis]MCW2471752.1 hypothetical protein [Elizabethkingia anophelis]